MATTKKNKSVLRDALGQAIPKVMPLLAEAVVKMIPEGTKIDDFFRNYHQYWGTSIDAISMIVKSFTNSDITDALLEELSAETSKAILDRYGKDGVISKGKKGGTEAYRLSTLKQYLAAAEFDALNIKIASLPPERQQTVQAYNVTMQLDEAKKFAENLAKLTTDQFILWADLDCPEPKPREKTELEQAVKQSLDEFKADVEQAANRGGFFARIARNKGLI